MARTDDENAAAVEAIKKERDARKAAIVAAALSGESFADIAKRWGLSRAVVKQIVKAR